MAKNESKLDVRQVYKDFASALCGCPFEKIAKPTDLTRALAKFYIVKVHNALKSEIDDDEFDDGYVDGAGDLDIDFIHRDDNRVLVVQSRYHGIAAAPEKASNIAHFQGVLSRMRSHDFKANSRLQDILGTIDWDRDSFELVYVTFSKLIGQAFDQTKERPSYPDDVSLLDERCSWDYFGEHELAVEVRRAANLGARTQAYETTLTSAGQRGKRSGVIEVSSGQYKSCVLAVEAPQLVAAYQAVGDALFSLNIRNFLGNTKNNQKVIDTARSCPENFFYFNNGISCLAELITVHQDRLVATKLQVINGAQTVKGLVRAAGKLGKAPSWDTHPAVVLVRVTEVGNYGSSGSFREDITRFNNTQNVIKDADFRSNDAVQRDLTEQFSSISRPGKRVAYQAKRTDTRPSNAEIIRLEEFAKVVYAFLGDPVSFSGSTSFLFDEDKGYSVIYGDGSSPWTAMPTNEFRLRAAIYWLGTYFETRLKAQKKTADDPIIKAALERKWFPIFVARLLLERAYPNDTWRPYLERLYKGDWRSETCKDREWADMLYELSLQVLLGAYRMASKGQSFVHRNWMRNPETVQQLREAAKDFAEFQLRALVRK